MSDREVKGAGVFRRVESEAMKLVEAAEVLGLSYRQAKRVYARYGKSGSKGLVHGNTGKRSNQAKPAKFRRRVLSLVKKHYGGDPGERFGPTLASEHLAEDHRIEVDAETLRRRMLSEGLWTKERKRKPLELPRLLVRAEEAGVRILWIALSYGAYEFSSLAAHQALNDPAHPLDSLSQSELNRELVKAAKSHSQGNHTRQAAGSSLIVEALRGYANALRTWPTAQARSSSETTSGGARRMT